MCCGSKKFSMHCRGEFVEREKQRESERRRQKGGIITK
jgi:hypothetical protein